MGGPGSGPRPGQKNRLGTGSGGKPGSARAARVAKLKRPKHVPAYMAYQKTVARKNNIRLKKVPNIRMETKSGFRTGMRILR
jgi:hypothetical protein